MSYSQKGYSSAGRVARKTDKDITSLQEIRSRAIIEPANNHSSAANSATGIPGYYSSQRGPSVTKNVYRRLAAIGSGPTGFGTGEPAQRRFYDAQGLPTLDADNPMPLDDAREQAMLKWEDRDKLRGFGVKLERDDVEFLEQKRAEELEFEFHQWLARRIDLDDPANSRWLQEVVPDFYERREKFIDDKINLEAALAKIRLRGANNKKDLQLLFALNNGLIKPSTVPLFGATQNSLLTAGRDYQPGMMSVLQWFAPRANGASNGASTTAAFAKPYEIRGGDGAML